MIIKTTITITIMNSFTYTTNKTSTLKFNSVEKLGKFLMIKNLDKHSNWFHNNLFELNTNKKLNMYSSSLFKKSTVRFIYNDGFNKLIITRTKQ